MKPNQCKHFTGVQHDICAAGLRYDDVRTKAPFPNNFPCLIPAAPCSLREYPTAAEVAEDAAKWERAMASIFVARPAIIAKHGKARGLASTMPCPVCTTGTLAYSIAHNGHIHAGCSTPTCVRWME